MIKVTIDSPPAYGRQNATGIATMRLLHVIIVNPIHIAHSSAVVPYPASLAGSARGAVAWWACAGRSASAQANIAVSHTRVVFTVANITYSIL